MCVEFTVHVLYQLEECVLSYGLMAVSFNLQLRSLRKEIKGRMKASVEKGKTISGEVRSSLEAKE